MLLSLLPLWQVIVDVPRNVSGFSAKMSGAGWRRKPPPGETGRGDAPQAHERISISPVSAW